MTTGQDPDAIWITSARSPDNAAAVCELRWGPREWYAPVTAVRQTAEDLFTCAAYADLIAELLRIGLETTLISQMTTAMLRSRQPKYFGSPDTLFVLPGGSSKRKQGVVMLARRNLSHAGQADAGLTPDEARAMGRHWLAAAEASEADTLFGTVLARAGWMTAPELDALFSLLVDTRAGKADIS